MVELQPLPAGWAWYNDRSRGYAVGISLDWKEEAGSTTATACPVFSTNPPDFPSPAGGKPNDDALAMCAVVATVCNVGTAASADSSVPIIVAHIATTENYLGTKPGGSYVTGVRSYSVEVPGNGLCYEIHIIAMSAVPQTRADSLRSGVWSSFTLFAPGSTVVVEGGGAVASSSRRRG